MTTEKTQVEITELEAGSTELYEIDPYKRSTGTPAKVYLYVNPETGAIYCETWTGGDGIPMPVYHERLLRWPIQPLTADAANDLMRQAAPLAARLIAGYEVRWDGNNNRGALSDDAEDANNEIGDLCEAAGQSESDLVHVYEAGDWLQDVSNDELGLRANMTAEEESAAVVRVEGMTDSGVCDRIDGADKFVAARLATLRADAE